jgi:hypothetical protein
VRAAGRRGAGAPPAEARLSVDVERAPREPAWRRRESRDSTKRTGVEGQSPSALGPAENRRICLRKMMAELNVVEGS